MPGSIRSSTTRCGRVARACCSAARPSTAVSTTKPSRSRYARTRLTMLASSSTTRIRSPAMCLSISPICRIPLHDRCAQRTRDGQAYRGRLSVTPCHCPCYTNDVNRWVWEWTMSLDELDDDFEPQFAEVPEEEQRALEEARAEQESQLRRAAIGITAGIYKGMIVLPRSSAAALLRAIHAD